MEHTILIHNWMILTFILALFVHTAMAVVAGVGMVNNGVTNWLYIAIGAFFWPITIVLIIFEAIINEIKSSID